MSHPTILDVAATIGQRPGFDPPTPRWGATLAYLYGLDLSDEQVAEVVAATQRSPEAVIEHARSTIGQRRFKQLWARVGRRGRKTATAALIGVYEAVWGGHEPYILPGEMALVAIISKDIAGATVCTRFARLYLDALGIRYTTTRLGAVQVIEIDGCQVGIATLAASSTAPRGYAIPVLVLDEVAHFPTGDGYVDTDTHVMTAAAPAMAQFESSLVVGISTGLGRDGIHYEMVERGLGNDQEHEVLAVQGTSWEWSPKDVTRERALEISGGDSDVMRREFEGGVAELESLAFVPEDVEAMWSEHQGRWHWGERMLVLDPAESNNWFTFGVCAWGEPSKERVQQRVVPPPHLEGVFLGYAVDEIGAPLWEPMAKGPLLRFFEIGAWTGDELRQTPMSDLVKQLASVAHTHGCRIALTDQRAAPYLAALLSEHSVPVRSFRYDQRSKHESVQLLRTLMRDRQISIVEHAEMKRQCLRYPRKVVGGGFKYGGHKLDDFVSLLITTAHAMLAQDDNDTAQTNYQFENAPTVKPMFGKFIASGR